MKKLPFILLLLALPAFIAAQNPSVRTGKFTVSVKADWNPSFTGTNHYYLDDEGNKVLHGSAVINQTKSNKDDLYSWGQYVDSYNDSRTYKANANYKHGHLDGAFSLVYNVNLTLRRNRGNNVSFSISLSGRFANGRLDGNWKLVTSGRQGSNKASNNVALVYNKGHLTKYDESSTLNGAPDRNIHISVTDDSIVSGSIVTTDDNITLLNGFASDRYYDSDGTLYESSQTEQDIVRRLASGEISANDIADMGYTLKSFSVYNINKNFTDIVNDDDAVNFSAFLGVDDQSFSTVSVSYKVLAEVHYSSYNEFAYLMRDFSPEQFDNILQSLSKSNNLVYNGKTYYLAPSTRQRLLDEIPALKANAENQICNDNREYLEKTVKSTLSNYRVELQEVDFYDDGVVKSASFRAYQDYSNGFGFATRQCSLVNEAHTNVYYPTSFQVQNAVSKASLIPNEWDDVQSALTKVNAHNDKVINTVASVNFPDIKQNYSSFFSSSLATASRSNANQALADLTTVFNKQNDYLRLVELRLALLANHDIIVNMDVKHGTHIQEAYLLYWSSLNKAFVSPAQIESLNGSIDIQSRIIAALRSDNVKKIDKKIKKSDDKSINTILRLIEEP